MKLRFLDHSWRKTLSFAVIHLLIAVTVGYALTGSFVLAGAFALIEPAFNTLVHHRLEYLWPSLPAAWSSRWLKSLVFTVSHLAIAVAVGLALTGSLAIAGGQALIEPLCNGVALVLFDRWWAARQRRSGAAAGAPLPALMQGA